MNIRHVFWKILCNTFLHNTSLMLMRKRKYLMKWNHIWILRLITKPLLICWLIVLMFKELVWIKSNLDIFSLALLAFRGWLFRSLPFWQILALMKWSRRSWYSCIHKRAKKCLKMLNLTKVQPSKKTKRIWNLQRKMNRFWLIVLQWVIFKNI